MWFILNADTPITSGLFINCVEAGGLVLPDADADVVEDVLQLVDVIDAKAAAEIACGGGIGNPAGAQGVEIDGVVAAQFDVLQASAVAQGIVSDVQDVIGYMVGQMDLEQRQTAVDGVDEADPAPSR